MPLPQKILFVLRDEHFDSPKLVRRKTDVVLKSHGRKPEFGETLVATNMDMRRLGAVVAGEQEPIRTDSLRSAFL